MNSKCVEDVCKVLFYRVEVLVLFWFWQWLFVVKSVVSVIMVVNYMIVIVKY